MEIRKRHVLFGLGLVLLGIGAVLRSFTVGRLYFDFNELFFYHSSHPLDGLGQAVQGLGVLMLLPFVLLTLFSLYKSWNSAKLEKQRLLDEEAAKLAQERAKQEAEAAEQAPQENVAETQEPIAPTWAPPPLSPSGGQPQ